MDNQAFLIEKTMHPSESYRLRYYPSSGHLARDLNSKVIVVASQGGSTIRILAYLRQPMVVFWWA
jgi:pyruvate kinase